MVSVEYIVGKTGSIHYEIRSRGKEDEEDKMTEIKEIKPIDKVRVEMFRLMFPYADVRRASGNELIDQFFAIKVDNRYSLKVVDELAEVPKNPCFSIGYRHNYERAQEDMKDYRKVIDGQD